MGFLLLGVDSLIACIAIGPIMAKRRAAVLSWLAVLFGVGDGAGYLLGTVLHYSMPDSLSSSIEYGVMVILGVYWLAVALISRSAAKAELSDKSRWGVWILPWLLSVDNITYGAVNGVPAHFSVWASAGEQALSSAVQAGIGLAIGIYVVGRIPAIRRRMPLANAITGVLIIAGAGIMYVTGW
jgi:putative Mn2+ efflux pump MntP